MNRMRPLLLAATLASALLAGCHSKPSSEATEQSPASKDAAAAAATPPAMATPDVATTIATQRATQAAIWGMPAVNYDLMRQQMLSKTEGKVNQVIYWGKPLDWHNQTLTPNPDTIYMMAFLNTRDVGPIVVEIPPASEAGSLNANFVNVWQEPMEDAGGHGIDQGKGVKLLLLPPDYKGKVPAGYEALQPGSYGSYALIRSNLKSHADADVAASIDYGKQVKIYPLSQAGKPPPTVFTDVAGADFDSTIRYDASFFDNLNHVVQEEPWLDRDRVMIDVLKSIGIEKGKPYAPSPELKQAQEAGVKLAAQYMESLYDAGFEPFYEGTHWTLPAQQDLVKAAQEGFSDPEAYPIDHRGLAYTYAFIGLKRMGAGQFYTIAIKDKDGKPFDGSNTYRLHVPADAPIEQYWSVTAYDRQTHALIRNVDRASRASNNTDVQKNPDGSVDLYIGPKAPEGKQPNWIPTDPQRQFELMFRAYGPTKAFFEKQWTLGDVERVN